MEPQDKCSSMLLQHQELKNFVKLFNASIKHLTQKQHALSTDSNQKHLEACLIDFIEILVRRAKECGLADYLKALFASHQLIPNNTSNPETEGRLQNEIFSLRKQLEMNNQQS